MKNYRKMLEEIGGWDNELVSVSAGSVRGIIEELEKFYAIAEELAEYPSKTQLDILVKKTQQLMSTPEPKCDHTMGYEDISENFQATWVSYSLIAEGKLPHESMWTRFNYCPDCGEKLRN